MVARTFKRRVAKKSTKPSFGELSAFCSSCFPFLFSLPSFNPQQPIQPILLLLPALRMLSPGSQGGSRSRGGPSSSNGSRLPTPTTPAPPSSSTSRWPTPNSGFLFFVDPYQTANPKLEEVSNTLSPLPTLFVISTDLSTTPSFDSCWIPSS